MWQKIKSNWPWLLVPVLAFALGRISVPTKVVTKSAETKTDTRASADNHAEAHTEAKTKIVYRDRSVVTHADGSVEHRDVEKDTTGDVTSATNLDERASAEVHSDAKTSEKTVTSDVPRWHVAVGVGANVSDALHPIYGAHVDYRLIGPLTVGAWGNSSGVGGVSIGLTF